MTSENESAVESLEKIGPDVRKANEETERRAVLDKEAPLVGDFLKESLALMKARATGQAKPIPLPWPAVAEALGGGMWPGLHVFTGATGTGKTQFALQVAWAASGANVPVLYVGLELGKLDVTARLLALAAGDTEGHTPKWSDLYLGKNDPSGERIESLMTKYGPEIAARPFRAEFGPPHGWPFDRLYDRARALRDENPETEPGSMPMLVVLDFLQAVGSPESDKAMTLRERIGRAAYAGRAVARDFGAAVLMVSSVSRESANRTRVFTDLNKEGVVTPNLVTGAQSETHPSDLVGLGKESGDFEYAADSVMTLVRDTYVPARRATPMWLAVAKVRAGEPAWCALEFNGSTFSKSEFVDRPTTQKTPKNDSKRKNGAATYADRSSAEKDDVPEGIA